jgi:hypothetical protein
MTTLKTHLTSAHLAFAAYTLTAQRPNHLTLRLRRGDISLAISLTSRTKDQSDRELDDSQGRSGDELARYFVSMSSVRHSFSFRNEEVRNATTTFPSNGRSQRATSFPARSVYRITPSQNS